MVLARLYALAPQKYIIADRYLKMTAAVCFGVSSAFGLLDRCYRNKIILLILPLHTVFSMLFVQTFSNKAGSAVVRIIYLSSDVLLSLSLCVDIVQTSRYTTVKETMSVGN